MLGMESPAVWLPYLLSLGSALFCLAYGISNWNRGGGEVREEDKFWLEEEKDLEEEI